MLVGLVPKSNFLVSFYFSYDICVFQYPGTHLYQESLGANSTHLCRLITTVSKELMNITMARAVVRGCVRVQ